jgi:hypothetical protein
MLKFKKILAYLSYTEKQYSEIPALSFKGIALAVGVLAGMLILVFGDLMVSSGDLVISQKGNDIYLGALLGREFTFEQLRQGNFMLWCPLSLCGFPAFGGFQSGLIYPPNFIYLIMPTVQAINWQFIIHTLMGGLFMYLWIARQGLHRYSCLAGAIMFAFCAPFYLRLFAGHLTPHCTISWIPLVFLAIDGIIAAPSLGWFLIGSSAVSMGLLGGYPQIWFYTGITALIYCAVKCFEAPKLRNTLLCLSGINIMALGLICVQWSSGFAMSQECVRSGGVPFEFAASFSLPFENWITLLRPGLMGDMQSFPYWGRWYLWEMCLYFGTAGLFFALVGLKHSHRRQVLLAVGLVIMTGILAMGAHTPLFRLLYNYVPGFNMFRSNSKFIILTVLFLIYLSAHGIDRLSRAPKVRKELWIGSGICCSILIIAWVLTYWNVGNMIGAFMRIPDLSGESYYPPNGFAIPYVVNMAAQFASREILMSVGVMSILTLLLFTAWKSLSYKRWLIPALILLICIELLMFAWQGRATFHSETIRQKALQKFLQPRIGESRIFSKDGANDALAIRIPDLWGYGSDAVNRRYAEFLAFTQGNNPDKVTGYQSFSKMHPRFDMLRCKFVISLKNGQKEIIEIPNPMPRFLLLSDWRIVTKRDAIFTELSNPSFDPWKTVLLERAPADEWLRATSSNRSLPENMKQIRVLRESTDWQEVEVNLSHPSLLLQTDLYTPNWRVRALPGSVQSSYELLSGNYILRVIPLQAGRHFLRIEYLPKAFIYGKWISLFSLLVFACAFGWWLMRRYRIRQPMTWKHLC